MAEQRTKQDNTLQLSADETQYLSFLLGKDEFGVNIMNVREILGFSGLTHVPMLPNFVRGVLNLRGHVVPVIDLGFRFHRKETEITKATCIIIVEIVSDHNIIDVGVLVDAVSEVINFSQSEVEPPPKLGTGTKIKTTFIEGMGKLENGFLILLNIGQVLDFDDLAVLEAAQERGKEILAAEAMRSESDKPTDKEKSENGSK